MININTGFEWVIRSVLYIDSSEIQTVARLLQKTVRLFSDPGNPVLSGVVFSGMMIAGMNANDICQSSDRDSAFTFAGSDG